LTKNDVQWSSLMRVLVTAEGDGQTQGCGLAALRRSPDLEALRELVNNITTTSY
jgi:hypothetical protein